MTEMHLEPPTSGPSSLPRKPQPSGGSLAVGVGQAWLIMVIGEVVVPPMLSITNNWEAILGSTLLPPLAIIAWGIYLSKGSPRQGKGVMLGLLSIAAVVLLLVAACFGLVSNNLH